MGNLIFFIKLITKMKYINLVLALGVSFINAHGSFQSYCTGEKDSCDDTLCCAIGTNGFVEDY